MTFNTIRSINPHDDSLYLNNIFLTFGLGWRTNEHLSHCLSQARKKQIDKVGLLSVLNSMLFAYNKAMVLKNVTCGFNADVLTEIHPRSLFVRIERNVFDVGRSILQGRLRYTGSISKWWSLKPSTWPFSQAIMADPAKSVAQQIVDCNKDIDNVLSKGVATISANYEDIVNDPKGFVSKVHNKLDGLGWHVEPRRVQFPKLNKLPKNFKNIPKSILTELKRNLLSMGCDFEY
jgi:hypothetical protein